MRTQSMPAALLGFSMLAVSQPSTAANDLWGGSYAADGVCYCLGTLDKTVHRTIVPTPVGGQSVRQICQRIGAGPALTRSEGLFNYPVYPDAQCGHGPGDVSTGEADGCKGSLNPESGDCQGIGPNWNLEAAYASPLESSTQVTGNETVSNNTGVSIANPESVRATVKSSLLTAPVVTTATETDANGKRLKATIIRSPSTAAHSSEPLPDDKTSSIETTPVVQAASRVSVSASSGSPAGRTVVIDGQGYRQARSDLSATGGSPGSRIILDGLVFLRDDGNLDPTDLYKVPTRKPVAQTAVVTAPPNAIKQQVPFESTKTTDLQESDEVRHQRLLAEARKRLRARQQARDTRTTTPDTTLPVPSNSETLAGETDDTSLAIPNVGKDSEPSVAAANSMPGTEKLPATQELDTAKTDAENDESIASQSKPLNTDESVDQDKAVAVTESAEQVGSPESSQGVLSALRLPHDVRASSRDFDYIDALPTAYDYGGGGMMVEASADSHSRFHYVGRVAVVNNYQEVMVGGGYYLTPPNADRMTVVLTAGLEYGNHEWRDEDRDINAESTDTGVYLGLSSRLVVNRHFELQGGAGYSGFFEGDPVLFGRGFIHVNRQIDLVSRFELGDNDSLGLGIRFYY